MEQEHSQDGLEGRVHIECHVRIVYSDCNNGTERSTCLEVTPSLERCPDDNDIIARVEVMHSKDLMVEILYLLQFICLVGMLVACAALWHLLLTDGEYLSQPAEGAISRIVAVFGLEVSGAALVYEAMSAVLDATTDIPGMTSTNNGTGIMVQHFS